MQMPLVLPIDDVLDELSDVLAAGNRAVLSAPPGAGKTTRVPLHLLAADWRADQNIIMLEPRRIAARRAAERMADMLGEKVGETVGLRSRLDTRVGPKTQIEVVTEGVFTNLITREPDLPGYAAVLFDEFHERSLDADLGLALALETQGALNEDLRILVMSATLETGRLTDMLGAPLVQSEGRAFPVETIYLGKSQDRLEDQMAQAIRKALAGQAGSVLAFLPGAAEINRTADRLSGLSDDIHICPLYGALPPKAQDEAIRPARNGTRKVVLATDIAESSLTIEGVRVVIDAGLARIPVFTPGSLGAGLRTVRASIANVDQRRGRAGRTEPGVCYRLWHEEENRGLPKAPPPEILATDLSSMLLRLADWGDANPFALQWLDPPAKGQVKAAERSLYQMGLLTEGGQLTKDGQTAVRMPIHPRLARLVIGAQSDADRALAALLAAMMSEVGLGGRQIDVSGRLAGFERDRSARASALKQRALQWAGTKAAPSHQIGEVLAKAWPEQLARVRPGDRKRFQLAGGGGARLPDASPLEGQDWLVIAETAGQSGGDPIIRLAEPVSEAVALKILPATERAFADYDPKSGKVVARRQKCLGEIVLSETPLQKPDVHVTADAVLRAIRDKGLGILPGVEALRRIQARAMCVRDQMPDALPDFSDEALVDDLDDWLLPILEAKGLQAIEKSGLEEALQVRLGWEHASRLDELAPRNWKSPTGRSILIDYESDQAPLIALRVQDVYGMTHHPAICEGQIPLTFSLLSPAQRPVALTRDLPGFWKGGYRDMRKDMKGRYPKHDWPEDPASAQPGGTRRR